LTTSLIDHEHGRNNDFEIVANHDDFVVISKGVGVDVHRDGTEAGIAEKVARALGLQQLYLVHRLDKVTSGLLLLAKSAASCAQLAELFRNKQVEKFYLAVSARKPKKKQGWVIGDMQRSRRGSWKLMTSKENPAVTQFFSQALQPGFRAFLLKPLTGKTHQLRVALKSIGAPICGDVLYDDAELAAQQGRTYLHAYQLSFLWQGRLCRYSEWPKSGEHFSDKAFEKLKAQWEDPASLEWPRGTYGHEQHKAS